MRVRVLLLLLHLGAEEEADAVRRRGGPPLLPQITAYAVLVW
jgi:hypothetical protein